jgi:hypothetical protein
MLSAIFRALAQKGSGQQGNPATQPTPMSDTLPLPAAADSTPAAASPLFGALLAQEQQAVPDKDAHQSKKPIVQDPNDPVIKSVRKAFGFPA